MSRTMGDPRVKELRAEIAKMVQVASKDELREYIPIILEALRRDMLVRLERSKDG